MTQRVSFDRPDLPSEARGLDLVDAIDITGSRVCLVTPHAGFKDDELFETKRELEKAGAKVYIASSSSTAVSGMFGSELTPDMLLDHVEPVDFQAVVLVGGFGVDSFFRNSRLMDLVNRAFHAGKVLGAIGTAPVLLAMAGVARGRKTTVWTGPTNDKYLQLLRLGGTSYTGEEVEIDWPLVTGTGVNGVDEFVEVMVEAIEACMEEEREVTAQAAKLAQRQAQREVRQLAQQRAQRQTLQQPTVEPRFTSHPELEGVPDLPGRADDTAVDGADQDPRTRPERPVGVIDETLRTEPHAQAGAPSPWARPRTKEQVTHNR